VDLFFVNLLQFILIFIVKIIKIKKTRVIKFFNDKNLKIDLNSVIKIIQDEYNLSENYATYIADFQKVINIHNGVYRFHYNTESDARFHNNFTNSNLFIQDLRMHLN
jgi:hypothetical protein